MNEKCVNNYNQQILKFWNPNMDIQPCGSNESIAHYIAKYISKTEPADVNEGVAQAVRQIHRDETNIARKLFKSCMRILKARQVSASECVYRLCHLPLRSSSRKWCVLEYKEHNTRSTISSVAQTYLSDMQIVQDNKSRVMISQICAYLNLR